MFMETTRLLVGLTILGSFMARARIEEDLPSNDEEFQKYCGNQALAELNACMCGFLNDRQAPQKMSKISRAPSTRIGASGISAGAPCVNGVAAGYPCMNADLMSFLPLQDLGARLSWNENNTFVINDTANDIWGWSDPDSGREFAIFGLRTGTSFVEITNPSNPIHVGILPTHGEVTRWRDIKTFLNHAFIVAEGGGQGMQVFDLSELLSIGNRPATFSEIAHYSGFNNSHNVFINEDTGFAYAVGSRNSTDNICSRGLHMIDVRNPTNPTYAGCFNADGYTHDVQCVVYDGPDVEHKDKEVCFCSNTDHITIVDVSNKAGPVQLSTVSYENVGYTHQGWLTEDQGFFLFGDEADEVKFNVTTKTFVLNVGDLDNPVLAGTYLSPTSDAIDHNMYVVGNHVFQANYRAGLRVLEINDIATASFTEVAYFDIYPSDNDAAFNGAWSNYPYFPSGNVVISGIEQGLFVISLNIGLESDPSHPSSSPTPVPGMSTGFCFSGENTITLDGGEQIPIQSLSIGDKVLVRDGSYESVYSFGHRNPTDFGDYLRLLTKSTALEISSSHMLLVGRKFVPASTVQLGDILSNGEAVSSIKSVSRQGVYAPFTPSGTIVVSNVVSSSFVSLQKDATYLMLGSVTLTISWQWMAHTFEMPHRFLSDFVDEAYTKEGISLWVVAPKLAAELILKQNVVVMSIILIPVVVGLGFLFLIGKPWFVVAVTLIGIFATRRLTKTVS